VVHLILTRPRSGENRGEGPATTGSPTPETDEVLHVEDEGPWYMGKGREEFNRRMRDAAAPGDDKDLVQPEVCTTCLTFHPWTTHLKIP